MPTANFSISTYTSGLIQKLNVYDGRFCAKKLLWKAACSSSRIVPEPIKPARYNTQANNKSFKSPQSFDVYCQKQHVTLTAEEKKIFTVEESLAYEKINRNSQTVFHRLIQTCKYIVPHFTGVNYGCNILYNFVFKIQDEWAILLAHIIWLLVIR